MSTFIAIPLEVLRADLLSKSRAERANGHIYKANQTLALRQYLSMKYQQQHQPIDCKPAARANTAQAAMKDIA